MVKAESSSFAGVGSTQQDIVDGYLSAFPNADVDALAVQFAFASLTTRLQEDLERRISEVGFDLSRPRYTVVRMLYFATEYQVAKSAIAEGMHVSGAYVTQLLAALEADGWVERSANPSDRRASDVRLTREGIERCSRLVPAVLDRIIERWSALKPKEKAELQRLIAKVLNDSTL